MRDLSDRLTNRVQLTVTDTGRIQEAVDYTFGTEIDYAMLVKLYGADPGGERRCSPPVYLAAIPQPVTAARTQRTFLRRLWTPELERPHDDAPLHSVVEWVFAQGREPHGRRGPQLFLVRLHQDPQQHSHDASDGRWRDEAPVRCRGPRDPARRVREKSRLGRPRDRP